MAPGEILSVGLKLWVKEEFDLDIETSHTETADGLIILSWTPADGVTVPEKVHADIGACLKKLGGDRFPDLSE